MTNTKNTKRALLSSVMALFLCFAMLIGTTYAWFTDSVTSAGNIIKSGTLDVTMEWKDATANGAQQTYKDASEGAIFNYDKWEPGYIEAKNIKISNDGTLALKYKIVIVANGEVSNLSDVIDVYYYDSEVQLGERADLVDENKIGNLTTVLKNFETTASGTLEAGKNHTVTIALKMQETAGNEYQNKSIGTNFSVVLVATQVGSENDSFNNQYDDGAEFPEVSIDADDHNGASDTVLGTTNVEVVIPSAAEKGTYTLETANPSKTVDADGKTTLTMDITLKRDGVKISEDGTVYTVSVNIGAGLNLNGITHNGNTVNVYSYDKTTGIVTFETTHFSPFAFTYDLGTKVESAENLGELVANGGIIQLSGNVELIDAPIVVKKGQSVVLNLNGYTLSGKSTSSTTSYLIKVENGAELIIQDGTVSFYATTPDTEWGGEGQPPFPGYANNTIHASGKLIVNDVMVDNLTAKGGASYAIDAYQGSDIIINEGSVINGLGKIAIRMFANSDKLATNVTVNGGKITGYRAFWIQLPGSNAESKKIANLTVNGGVLESTDEEYFDAIYSYSYGDSFANTTITLNGGEFIGDVAMSGGTKVDRETLYVDWENCKFAEGTEVIYYTSGDPIYCVPVDTAEELKAAVEAGNIATLIADIDVNANTAITIASGKNITVDLNGYKISATANKTGNQELFLVKGTLTVKNGAMELVAENNQGWNAMATIFDVTAGGVLNLENVSAKVSGTDMNFVVHLNNWGAATANITDCDFDLSYVAVRAFNSGYDMNTVTIKNTDVTGGARLFWVHNYTSEGKDDTTLNLDIYNNGNTCENEKPVRFGFSSSSYYNLEGSIFVSTADELKAALENGGDVVLGADINITDDTAFEVAKGIKAKLYLNGYNITATSNISDQSVQLFNVSGDLEIVGNGTISLTSDNFAWSNDYRYAAIGIRETGVVTLGEGVKVVCEASKDDSNGMSYAVDIYKEGTLNVNGASLHSNYIAVRCFFGDSVVNVNSGSITSAKNNWGIWPQSSPNAKITVADGIDYSIYADYGIYIFG